MEMFATNPFEGLPDELLMYVFEDSGLETLLGLRLVDRRFRNVASEAYDRQQKKYRELNRRESGDGKEFDRYVSGVKRDFKKDYEKHLYKNAFTPAYFRLKKRFEDVGKRSRDHDGMDNDLDNEDDFSQNIVIEGEDLPLVPREIEGSRAEKLIVLGCGLREIVPLLSRIPTLEQVVLHDNGLTDLPTDLFESSVDILDVVEPLQSLPANAAKSKLQGLRIARAGLDKIPDEVFGMKNLIYLNLSHNNIKEIPDEIGLLQNVTHLLLSSNALERVSPEIGRLKKLVRLDVSDNPGLKHLPDTIVSLKHLKKIEYSTTGLEKSPVIDKLIAKRGGARMAFGWTIDVD